MKTLSDQKKRSGMAGSEAEESAEDADDGVDSWSVGWHLVLQLGWPRQGKEWILESGMRKWMHRIATFVSGVLFRGHSIGEEALAPLAGDLPRVAGFRNTSWRPANEGRAFSRLHRNLKLAIPGLQPR